MGEGIKIIVIVVDTDGAIKKGVTYILPRVSDNGFWFTPDESDPDKKGGRRFIPLYAIKELIAVEG